MLLVGIMAWHSVQSAAEVSSDWKHQILRMYMVFSAALAAVLKMSSVRLKPTKC